MATNDSVLAGGSLKRAFDEGTVEPIEWCEVTVGGLVVSVATDAVRARVDDVPLRLPVSYEEQVAICRSQGWVSPTFAACVAMYAQAKAKLQFVGLVNGPASEAKMRTLGFTRKIDSEIEKQLAKEVGLAPGDLRFGAWKLWILDPGLAVRGAVNHGFWNKLVKPPQPIQRAGTLHDAKHTDYSQMLQPVKRMARDAATGAEVDLLSAAAWGKGIPAKYLQAYDQGTRAAPAFLGEAGVRDEGHDGDPPAAFDLGEALALAGVDLVMEDGWEDRGFPGFHPVGVMVHHTATGGPADAPTLRVCIDGRPGLRGPLCHLLVARSGRVHLIASKLAQHAGPGAKQVLAEVMAETRVEKDAAARGFADTEHGNPNFFGIEVENEGLGHEPYPEAQIRALVLCCAAICRGHGWGAARVIHHRQWTARKIDMSYRGDLVTAVEAELLL